MQNLFAAVNYSQVNTTTNNNWAGQQRTTITKRNKVEVEVDVGIVNKARN